MKIKILSFCLFTAILVLGFKNDNDPIKIISEKLDKFRKEFPQEKVHLHFDKPVYSIGDTMYFKAYIVNAEKNMPSAISNILYVDMTNENNLKEHKTILLPIADGVIEGSMVVSDTLQTGNYQIRAYTNWMRNFDEADFYHREFVIGNALNDEVQMHTAFKADSVDENKVTAEINYSTINNNSFSNKEVKYTVMQDGKEIQKGKTDLDEKGKFKVDLSKLSKNLSYQLTTNLKEDKNTDITRSIDFNLPNASHSFHFFPEGGQMINGLQSRVGFKATDLHGEGMDVSGIVKDETGKQVADFSSSFAGMGSFTITPEAPHTYTATLKYKNGIQERRLLPKAENEGCDLALENDNNENINLKVSTKGVAYNHLILITQCNNRIQYTQKLELVNNTVNARLNGSRQNESCGLAFGQEQISTKKFPTGIIQFTIFDASLKPLAERLVFVNHNDQLKINIPDLKKIYSKRKEAKLTFQIKDEEGNPVAGNFSVSVTNSNIFPDDKNSTPNIVSDLLLTSDLKGNVENPNYYFENINQKKIQELDNLMLTQGWRRFKWDSILSDQYPAKNYLVEKDLRISGRVFTKKKMPAAHAIVNIISKGGKGFTAETKTNDNGNFVFDNLDFTGDISMVVQAMSADSSRNVIIEMNNRFSSPPIMLNPYLNNVDIEKGNGFKNYLIQSQKKFEEWRKYGRIPENTKVLKEVKVTGDPRFAKQMEAVQGSYNLNGPGQADQIFTYEDLKHYALLSKFLQGHALGLYLKEDTSGPWPRPVRLYSTRNAGGPVSIYIDGIGFGSEPDMIPAYDIQSVEILRSGGYLNVYGKGGNNGIIVITTKQGGIDYNDTDEDPNTNNVKGLLFTNAKGYAKIREFYSPDYSNPETNKQMEDLRTTIYWKPLIKPDDDGNAIIDYYNGDVRGTYTITIEGITEFGETGSASFNYQVQ